jgi:hypothetical protein
VKGSVPPRLAIAVITGMMIMVVLAKLITAPVVRHQPQFNGCGHKEPSVSSVWPNVLFYYFCANSNTNTGKQHIIVALGGNALLKQGPRHDHGEPTGQHFLVYGFS